MGGERWLAVLAWYGSSLFPRLPAFAPFCLDTALDALLGLPSEWYTSCLWTLRNYPPEEPQVPPDSQLGIFKSLIIKEFPA
jgi:hypothetical protein